MNAPRLAAALAACLCVAARAGDVLVEDVAHMEQYRWTRGCTPSAAAMVLSYIDNHYVTHKGLVRWYVAHRSNGNNVPQILDWLADDMYTSSDGNTSHDNIAPGIKRTTDNRCGYNFDTRIVYNSTDSSSEGYDWCWGLIKSEIGAGRPFVWSVTDSSSRSLDSSPGGSGEGHSLAAVGYDSATKEVVVKDSNRSGMTYWRYNVYDYSSAPAASARVITVKKCGGYPSGVALESLQYGESIPQWKNFTIRWYQDGDSSIKKVGLATSVDGGYTWQNLIAGARYVNSAPGWNSYIWGVTNPAGSYRVRILGYDSNYYVRGGDGSRTNFHVGSPSTPLFPTLGVNPVVRRVGPSGGTTTFGVRNVCGGALRYAAAESVSWLGIYGGASGGNSGTISVSFAANPGYVARTGTITVAAAGTRGSPRRVKIIQAGKPVLSVAPWSQSVESSAGTTNFSILNKSGGTMRYSVTELVPWLTIASGASGINAGIVTVSFSENLGTTARTGTITVTATGAGGSPKRVKVVQARSPLALTPTCRAHPSSGATGLSFAVSALYDWYAFAPDGWITVVDNGYVNGNGTVSYSVATNAGAARSGTILINSGVVPWGVVVPNRSFTVYQWPASATPGVSAEGDFDGDARADVAVFNPASGNWAISFSTGPGWMLPWGWSATVPVPADYDGDGLLDLAVYHPATGNWHIQEGGTGQNRVVQLGYNQTVPLPGDYDGDGKADLAVFHQAQGRWYFHCTTAGKYNVQWGWSTTIPVPADYDGDGKTDIAVYHPPSGLWQILKSSTGGAIQKTWGWSTALPVPADYDGDGKADVAVFHRATGTWRISYSGGGSRTKQFGWSSTIPVAADYDGDSRTDLAVYHPATGNWYILKSTTEGTLVKNWGWSATKPTLLYPLIHSWFGMP